MNRYVLLAAALVVAAVAPAHAQLSNKPLPRVVADLRGFYSNLGQDPVTASELTPPVTTGELPGHALGGVAGVHVYLLRGRRFSFGVGGEVVTAQGRAQQKDEVTDQPIGPRITQRMRGLSGQMSLNFGQRDGWSYVSAGMGPLTLNTYNTEQAPADSPPRTSTINLGAGARWFASRHFAFCFDLRFYETKPEVATGSYPGRERKRVRILSAGIAIR